MEKLTPEKKEKILKELDVMAKNGFAITAMFAREMVNRYEAEQNALSASQDECRRLRELFNVPKAARLGNIAALGNIEISANLLRSEKLYEEYPIETRKTLADILTTFARQARASLTPPVKQGEPKPCIDMTEEIHHGVGEVVEKCDKDGEVCQGSDCPDYAVEQGESGPLRCIHDKSGICFRGRDKAKCGPGCPDYATSEAMPHKDTKDSGWVNAHNKAMHEPTPEGGG